MKKQFFSFILAGVCAAGLALAEPQQHGRNAEHRMEMLSKRLNLTADQQAKLAPIMTDRQQQMRAIFKDSSLSREDRMAKIKAVRKDSNAKIEALLTYEQKQNFEQLQQQRRQHGPEHRIKMLSKRLNLTADQQAKLAPIMAESRQQIRAIFQDSSLSKEDRIAKFKAVRKDSNAKIEALLTDEQKQNFEQLQEHMKNRAHGHRGQANAEAPTGNGAAAGAATNTN
jgi:Spy/CpxP family protein refolding chaperone